MKSNVQKVMRVVFALCMALVMSCSVVTNAQAAGFQKSFTKTAAIKGGQQCVLTMQLKKDTKVKVTVSTTSKNKKLNVQAIIAGVMDGDPYFVNLDSKHKKGSFTVNVTKGTHQLYVTNYAMGKEKVKIKVSVNGKVLKYKKKQTIEEIA